MDRPKLFGREPTVWISTLAAVLTLAVGFGVPGFDDGLVAAITAFLTAAAALATAFFVQPVAPALFAGVVATGATLLAAFGLDLSQEKVAVVTAAVVAIYGLLTRAQVTPAADPSDKPV